MKSKGKGNIPTGGCEELVIAAFDREKRQGKALSVAQSAAALVCMEREST